MSRIFALTKIILKSSGEYLMGPASNKKQKRAAKSRGPWGTIILFLALFAITGFSLGMSAFSISLLAVNAQVVPELVTLASPFAFIFLWIFTMTIVISTFFLSNDTQTFLPLPVKPSEIFFARFMSCLFSTYLLEFLFLLPIFIGFNVAVEPFWTVYIYQLFLFLALPLLPLAITFLLAMLIAKVFNIAKHRDLFNVIMAAVMVGIILVMQFTLQSPAMGDPNDPNLIADLLKDAVSQMGGLAYILQFPRDAMIEAGTNGLFGLVVFLFFSAAIFMFAFYIAEKNYLKIMLDSDVSKGKKRGKANLDKEMLKEQKVSSPFFSLVIKEWRTIMRSPNYVFQLVVPPILVLVIYGVTFGVMFTSGAEGMPELSIDQLIAMAQSFVTNDRGGLVLLMTGISLFIASMSQVSATAISREGRNAYLMRVIPQKPVDQIRAKIFLGISISSVILLVLYVSVAIVLQIPLFTFIQIIIPSFIALILANYLMVLVDVKSPMLVWENELAPVKQNKTVFFGMLICWALAIVFTIGGIFLLTATFPVFYAFAAVSVLCALGVYLIERAIQKKGSAILNSIE